MSSVKNKIPSFHNYELRSSTRKRTWADRCIASFTESTRKKRKVQKKLVFPRSKDVNVEEEATVPRFDLLPNHIWSNIFKYLPVATLETLSTTCSTLNSLIKGNYITTLDFPFHTSFISELKSVGVLEKKPLLRLCCKKSRRPVCPTAMLTHYDDDQNMHWFMMETTLQLSTYLTRSQMSLLSLSHLRELDLVPQSFRGAFNMGEMNEVEVNQYLLFDRMLLDELFAQGILKRLSRLGVLLDQNMYLQDYIESLPSLLQLQLYIMTRDNLKRPVISDYIYGLEQIVMRSRAKELKIVVIKETRRKLHKLLSSNVVERLHIAAPCTFGALLLMKNLKEVVYEPKQIFGVAVCTHWLSRNGDRMIHRDGLCCIDFSPVMKWCPRLKKFGGIILDDLTEKKINIDKWIIDQKKKFYRVYVKSGGDMSMTVWAKKRWVKKCNIINPAEMRWV